MEDGVACLFDLCVGLFYYALIWHYMVHARVFLFMCEKLVYGREWFYECVCITSPSRDGLLSRWSSSDHSGAE